MPAASSVRTTLIITAHSISLSWLNFLITFEILLWNKEQRSSIKTHSAIHSKLSVLDIVNF